MGIEKINQIQNECGEMFNLLQHLNAPMTENNIAVLNACLGSLKMIGQMCEEAKKEEVKADARETDTE